MEKEYMKYAVVIVTYNRPELLKKCVECVEQQSLKADYLVIVDNHSDDGTEEYLRTLLNDERYVIFFCKENTGGAGGFCEGLNLASDLPVDWITVIDDDAMLRGNYMERLLGEMIKRQSYLAAAGKVCVNGVVDCHHRKNMSRVGMLFRNCPADLYDQPVFVCDNASFCGLTVSRKLVRQIGLPHKEYFIWHDDTEYSIRIRRHTQILVVSDAVLDHETQPTQLEGHRHYTWKDYYGYRNRLLYVEEHCGLLDRIINHVDFWIHVVFRNWCFAMLKVEGSRWEEERRLVKRAIHDARNMYGKID